MLAIRDTLLKHPHASLFVVFVGAFTVFALSGDDPRRKKPSLFKRALSYLLDEKSKEPKAKRSNKRPARDKSQGIVVLLESNAAENIYQSCWTAQLRSSMYAADDGTGSKGFERIIEQLKLELNEEREARQRLHDSVKREESLRLDAEEGLRLLEQELTRQKRKTKKLKKERSRMRQVEQRLREEETKVRGLEKRLESEQARAERFERELSKNGTQNGFHDDEDSSEDEEERRVNIRNTLSGSGKKRVFTII